MKSRLLRLIIALLAVLCCPTVAQAHGGGHWASWARRPWHPRDVGTLLAAYDANAGVTIATGVSTWVDQSGNGNTISQATTSKQPARLSSAINGLPAIQLDGTDDFFSPITFTGGATGNGGTYFFVSRADALFASGTHDFLWVSAAGDGINPGVQVTTTNYALIAGGGLNAGEAMPIGSFHEYTFVHTSSAATCEVRRDGASKSLGDDGHTSAGGNGFTLGALSGGTRSAAHTFAYILIYRSALSAVDRARVEKYLSFRFAFGF